jgi:aminoglycoside phosphotransferase family enzyme/predicted kinase
MPKESHLEYLKRELQRRDDGEPPTEMQTHISRLLLGASIVWKLKKAVKLPYLDFSTPEHRLALSRRELELNRRTAPDIYRKVMRLVRTPHGEWQLDGNGELVEAVLEMRRFDEQGLLDRMATAGRITPALIGRLAHVVAEFHARAQPALQLERSGSERVGEVLRINEEALESARSLHDTDKIDGLIRATRAAWQKHAALLDARQRDGHVRRCHGDLHLRNIVVIEGVPTLFDCLEFDEGMATIDVLYDLAFVLMDLWHRGADKLANLLLNRYLDEAPQTDGLPLLGLFMSMRATVRGHVSATRALEMPPERSQHAEAIAESLSYLDLASQLLQPRPRRLLAIGGLSGSGKSTAAAAVASVVGPAPGARVLSSDRIRKALHGVTPETRLGAEAYQPEVSAKVYAALRERASAVAASGHSVVVDAVFDRPDERERIAAVARGLGVDFQGVWLEAPQTVLLERVAARRGDPSDADTDVVRRQLERDVGDIAWTRLPADGSDPGWSRLLALVSGGATEPR